MEGRVITADSTDEEIRQMINDWADALERQGIKVRREDALIGALATRDRLKKKEVS